MDIEQERLLGWGFIESGWLDEGSWREDGFLMGVLRERLV